MRLLKSALILVCVVSLAGQEFGLAWEKLITLDGKLERFIAELESFELEKAIMQSEIENLKIGRTWYNGWINELLSARKTNVYAALLDSTAGLQQQIARLKAERDLAFGELKNIYNVLIQNDELTVFDKERAINLGNWLMEQPGGKIDLPDYTTLIEIEYEDEQIRQLVWRDLKEVVSAKLILVDSLLLERSQEQELLARLNEFHDDLSLLQESDSDLGSPASSRSVFANDEATLGGGENEVYWDLTAGEKIVREPVDITLIEQSNINIEGATAKSALPAAHSPSGEISRLIVKRQHYQEILFRLEAELPPDN